MGGEFRGGANPLRYSPFFLSTSLIMPFIPNKTDLPSFEEAFHGRHDCPGLESIYKNCILAAYAAATTEIQRMNLSVLGFLLIWPLNHTSLSEVVRRVKRCFDNKSITAPYERLNALGEFYVKYFILPCTYMHGRRWFPCLICP